METIAIWLTKNDRERSLGFHVLVYVYKTVECKKFLEIGELNLNESVNPIGKIE